MASANRALLLDEVIIQIFSQVRSPDLSAIARTCTAWTEPAMDILWADVELLDLLAVVCPIESASGYRKVGVGGPA